MHVVRQPQKITDYTRFCPGEEKIKISDAICLQRRRGNFPKCKGCQFNDDEQAAAETEADNVPDHSRAIAEVFKAYDVRAKCPEPLSGEVAWRIGQAISQFLRAELRGYDRGRKEKAAIVTGRDMRKTSPELASALQEGIRSAGCRVLDIGMTDTAQLYFAVNHLTCCGGVMVTASHNTADYNGFKICGEKARPVSGDTGLSKIAAIAANTTRSGTGKLAGYEQIDLSREYKSFVLRFVRRPGASVSPEKPLRVVVDAANGMAGRWLPIIYSELDWLEIIPLNFEHSGEFVHAPDPLIHANLRQLADRVIRSKADYGAGFDGDADRVILVDEKGKPVRGDFLTVLLAREFLTDSPGASIVYDVRASRVVREEIRKSGGMPRRERCGSAYLKKALADAKGVFGGELSGHYYYRDNWYCDSGMITFAHVLNLLSGRDQPLSKMVEPLHRYADSGERNFICEDPQATINLMTKKYAHARIDHMDGITVQFADWWFNVRPSHTEPLVRLNMEAKTPDLLNRKLREVYPLLGTPVDA